MKTDQYILFFQPEMNAVEWFAKRHIMATEHSFRNRVHKGVMVKVGCSDGEIKRYYNTHAETFTGMLTASCIGEIETLKKARIIKYKPLICGDTHTIIIRVPVITVGEFSLYAAMSENRHSRKHSLIAA